MKRRCAWVVVAVSAAYLAGWTAYEVKRANDMAMTAEKELHAKARECAQNGDYDGAFEACRELDKTPSGHLQACVIRGECFDRMGKLPEALVQYQIAAPSDHVAASSAADVARRLQKAGQ